MLNHLNPIDLCNQSLRMRITRALSRLSAIGPNKYVYVHNIIFNGSDIVLMYFTFAKLIHFIPLSYRKYMQFTTECDYMGTSLLCVFMLNIHRSRG